MSLIRYTLTFLLFFFCVLSIQSQIGINQDNMESVTDIFPQYSRPGVSNSTAKRGVVIRYETQPDFMWKMPDNLAGGNQKVSHLEQFTFKFKIPVLNKPRVKFLLGYEWDTEKYYFANPNKGISSNSTLFQLLDERRLKANKLSSYLTYSFNEKFYLTGRFRVSYSGDYPGLFEAHKEYRSYGATVAYGKKISPEKEWAVGLTFSSNQLRTLALPFFIYNHTFNDRWGLQTALPALAYIRYNTGSSYQNSILLGATFDSKFYNINTRKQESFQDLGGYYLRNNGVRIHFQYEHRFIPWVWASIQGGIYVPINSRFNSVSDIDSDIKADIGTRPFMRIGVFLSPPKKLMQ